MSTACTVLWEMINASFVKSAAQCRGFSTDCAELFPDTSLDFIYVDARHDRKGVLQDLVAYWPKLRQGGVMAGHDYMMQDEPHADLDPGRIGDDWTTNFDGTSDASGRAVRGAVNDFFSGVASESPAELRKCPRQPVISYREASWNTWIVRIGLHPPYRLHASN